MPASMKRTATTVNEKKKRHLKLTAGMSIMPSKNAVSTALTITLFFSHADFSPNFVNVITTKVISATANKIKNVIPMI